MEEKKHIYYFDYLRVFAAVCVVFMHTAADPLRMPVEYIGAGWHFLNVLTSLAFSAVPLFFMISGYLLMSSKKTADVHVLVRKRLPRLVLPLAAFSVLAVLWLNCSHGTFALKPIAAEIAQAVSSPAMVHLWFMYTLIALYLISPILYGGIRTLNQSGRNYCLILICIVVLIPTINLILPQKLLKYTDFDIVQQLSLFGGHLCAFLLGYFIGAIKRRIPNLLIVAVGLLDFAVIVVFTYLLTMKNGGYDATFQNQSMGFEILLAACIFLFAKQNLNRSTKWVARLTTPIAKMTFSIYLMHNIILSMFYYCHLAPPTSSQTVWLTLLNFAICFVTIKTLASIKLLCFLFTGISYEAACGSCNWVYTYRWIREATTKKSRLPS